MALNFPANPTNGQTYFNWSWDGVKWTRIAETTAASGVTSFNTRTGAVTLSNADVTAAGGASLASPALTGTPTTPTPAPGDNSTNIANTAFVNAAVAGSGVRSFNTRTGAVTLTTADVTGAGGAPIASPALTGSPTAPTPVPTDSSTALATTAFVAASYAPLNSPVLTGTPAAPTVGTSDNSTKIASTAFVQSQFGSQSGRQNRNRIINGQMIVDQRNARASITPATNQFVADRWTYQASLAGKFSSIVQPWNSVLPAGLEGALQLTSTAATTPGASDFLQIFQQIEWDNIADLQWGSSRASPVTLSFWAYCSAAGTYGGVLSNGAGTRSYPFQYTVGAGVWTFVSITVPGDTAGTWYTLPGDGQIGMFIEFDLGSGATNRGPANAWAGANYIGASGSGNVCATNGAIWALSNVQLEIGSQATPFDYMSIADVQLDCYRYYRQTTPFMLAHGYAPAGNQVFGSLLLPTPMCIAPTVSFLSTSYSNASALATFVINTGSITFQATATATGVAYANAGLVLSTGF